MSAAPQEAWFYTREGERIGPVAFHELRLKAAEGVLHPRHDMVWTQGMDAWQPAGWIEGLFERRTTPAVQEVAATVVDEAPPAPAGETVEEAMSREEGWPGVRRRAYLFMVFVFPVLWNVALGLVMAPLAAEFGAELAGWVVAGAILLSVMLVLYVVAQRFANLGMSRWWIFGNLVPFLNLWTGYRCFACPAGYAFHKKLDGAGVFLAILYWLFIAAGLAVVVLGIAILAGSLGDPETQQQVRDFITENSRPLRDLRP